MSASLNVNTKLVAAAATPEVLGAASILFNNIQFIAENAVGVSNTGNITIQLKNPSGTFTDAKVIEPGQAYNWPAPAHGYFDASQFTIKAAQDGDGVRYIYSLSQ